MECEKWLIRGARLIDPANGVDEAGDLLIEDGRIAAAGTIPQTPDGVRVIDARGLCAAPGLVDMHVHLRDPGFTYKEDLFTGTAAAAAGGITSVAAMPNTSPAGDSPETLSYILNKAAGASARVYPIAAVTVGQRGEQMVDFEALANAGAVAFSDDGQPVAEAAQMAQAMKRGAALQKAVISHCEDRGLANGGIVNESVAARLKVKGVPAAAEEVQVARECALSLALGVPVHIAHASTLGAVGLIRDAKRRGAKVTCETCPHYFSLDDSYLLKRDADYRMNPPLRTKEDVEAVIEGLRDGTIDAIATDHAPHTPQEKADFEKAPNGIVGFETLLAVGVTWLVKPGRLTLSQLIEKLTHAPAKILGIPAGTLAPGAAADIVLFDPEKKWTVDPERFLSKSRNTPYKGMELYGRVVRTFCGGKQVYLDKNP